MPADWLHTVPAVSATSVRPTSPNVHMVTRMTLTGPSRTSQAVALTRADLDRPHSADGDPSAQRALCSGLTFTPPDWLRPGIEARTRFMDEHVQAAIAAGVRQIVICGAGLDDRALRFRTSGVRFFELDHPVTQADKASRLRDMRAGAAGPTLAACDFQVASIADVLRGHEHDRREPTLFLSEGLLVYLDQPACLRLLAGMAASAAAGSTLAVTMATHASELSSAQVAAAANARRRNGGSEPWLTILRADEHPAMLAQAGWSVTATAESPVASADVSHGRRSLLVTAVPAVPGWRGRTAARQRVEH
jgi:methyltransferase (TIGR00027 family)